MIGIKLDYLPVHLIRNKTSYFLLWCGNDDVREDQILSVENQTPHFSSLEKLYSFASTIDIEVNRDAVFRPIDLDSVERWVVGEQEFSPTEVLDAWNVFSDFLIGIETWRMVHEKTKSAAEAHYLLSQVVFDMELNKSIRSESLSDQVVSSIKDVIKCGIYAFDTSVANQNE